MLFNFLRSQAVFSCRHFTNDACLISHLTSTIRLRSNSQSLLRHVQLHRWLKTSAAVQYVIPQKANSLPKVSNDELRNAQQPVVKAPEDNIKEEEAHETSLPPRSVGLWLMISSSLVFAIVVVGGVTRLTESGLSITEWRPITGVLPPLSNADWDIEFAKYRATPEFKLLNQNISMEDFKRIYYMEWTHRILGRLIGVIFVAPLIYFTAKRKISTKLATSLGGLALLLGGQGFLGWYMVQSGLDDAILDTPGSVPRVSQYRLVAHLGLALLLYAGMFATGLHLLRERKFSLGKPWKGITVDTTGMKWFSLQARILTALVLMTALSGAFVAGLDAGLVYNEFPLMGGRLVPPWDELFSSAYAKESNRSDLWWRNIFENPTTVQFDHRLIATSTYFGIAALYAQTFRKTMRGALEPAIRRATAAAFFMANVQVALGISTLLYLVPVPLAACHQAGSVLLLSAMLHVLLTLRRPSAAAALRHRMVFARKAPLA